MVSKDFKEVLKTHTFEYGDHEIEVEISVQYLEKSLQEVRQCLNYTLKEYENWRAGMGESKFERHQKDIPNLSGYHRVVTVEASRDEVEVEHTNNVVLDYELVRLYGHRTAPPLKVALHCFFKALTTDRSYSELVEKEEKKQVPGVTIQVREASQTVFEELDEMYQYTQGQVETDIELALKSLETSTSWTEIDDELEKLFNQLSAESHREVVETES